MLALCTSFIHVGAVYAHFECENVHTADKDSDLMLTVLVVWLKKKRSMREPVVSGES